jgi:hypothetical protein
MASSGINPSRSLRSSRRSNDAGLEVRVSIRRAADLILAFRRLPSNEAAPSFAHFAKGEAAQISTLSLGAGQCVRTVDNASAGPHQSFLAPCPPFRFHQIDQNVVDAGRVAFAFGALPLQNPRVQPYAHGDFALAAAQAKQL